MATFDSSLFGGQALPADLQRQLDEKQATEFAQLSPSQQLGNLGFSAGRAVGRGVAGAFGVDVQDPIVKQAALLRQLSQGIDLKSSKGLNEYADRLIANNLPAQAAQIADMAREVDLTQAKTTSLVEDKQAARDQQLMLAREKIQAQIDIARERGATQLQIAQMMQDGRMQVAQLAAALKGEKPLTEYQGKAVTFGTRAAESSNILNNLEGEYSSMSANYLPSFLNSTKGQQAQQAQQNFINAVLRQESGAAINASEFDNARKQYFPQPGDKPEVIAQKKRNRELVIKGFTRQAGPGGADIKEVFNNPPPKVGKTSFNSVADAEKANLPKGTIITIGGKQAIVE